MVDLSQWSRKFCQRGSNTDIFFLMRRERIQIPLKLGIVGPPAKCHLNGISLVCPWWPNIECWLGRFVICRGSRPVLLRNPIFLWFFRGGVPTPVPPPLWICTWVRSHQLLDFNGPWSPSLGYPSLSQAWIIHHNWSWYGIANYWYLIRQFWGLTTRLVVLVHL